jgi:hypothetical protein
MMKKGFPYWSPKSSKAVIARHWAGYLVFFDDAIGKLKSYFFMQNAEYPFNIGATRAY